MRMFVLATAAVLAACDNSAPSASRIEQPAHAPATVATAGDAGTASADDPVLQRLVAETLDYTNQMLPLLASWDGSCAAQIERMKKIEPLVQRIREDTAALGPDVNSRLKAGLAPHKAETTTNVEQQLADLHLTRPQIEEKEQAIKATCGADPDFKAEMDRIGVFKKKTP